MTIATSNIKFYKSAVVGSGSTNGGGMSANQIVSGLSNNLWPNILKSELDAGSILDRKVFIKVDTDNNETLADVMAWNEAVTPGDDYVLMFAGTLTDTQADADDSDLFGAATIVSVGATTVVCNVENASYTGIFADGKKVRLSNKALPDSATGDAEILTISGTPSVVDAQVTFTTDSTIEGSYSAGDKVHSILELDDIQAVLNSFVVTSSAGTFDDTNYPVTPNNLGAIHETITCTFSDNTYFVPVSSVRGTLTTGNVGEDYVSEDSDENTMWTIPYLAFGGTYANGDTIVFEVYPSAVAFWLRRIVPAGSTSYANNSNISVAYGQSA